MEIKYQKSLPVRQAGKIPACPAGRKNQKNKLKFEKADIRRLNDMKKVVFDKKWLKKSSNFELYYMWRGLKEKKGIRYDITAIPPRRLGKEFVKTKGHYHTKDCPEVYKVLSGRGIFLLQKLKRGVVEEVYYIKAKKGQYTFIPPLYGHATINSFSKELLMANWVPKKCASDYKTVERKEGFCYYYTKSGWLKNKKYKKIPKLISKRPLNKKPKFLVF